MLRNRNFKIHDKGKSKPRIITLSYIKLLFWGGKNSPKSVSDPNQHGNQSMRTYSFSPRSKAAGLEKQQDTPSIYWITVKKKC